MYVLTNSKINAFHKRMVFRFIWKRRFTSRPEICKVFGFSKSTVSEIIRDLEEEGLITVSGFVSTRSPGRKPEVLLVNPNGPKIISTLLKDSGEVEVALLNLDGEVVKRKGDILSIKTPEYAVQHILKILSEIWPSSPVLGVGIGVPGIVDHKTGRIDYSAHFQWRDIPFREMIRKEIPCPVFVENRTIAATLGEMWFGKGLESRNFICINCGDALGAGIVVEEKVYRGNLNGVGEVGHISVNQCNQEETCSCGQKGCAETIASLPAIMRRVGEIYHSEKECLLFLRMRRNNPKVKELLQGAFRVVGEVVAVLINVLAPERIIFTGALPKVDPSFFLHEVKQTVTQRALYPLSQKVILEISPLQEDEEVLWGAAIVMEHLFSTEVMH